jgi:predicted aconitase
MIKLKHFGAAAASSGGVEMYHIPGVTPRRARRNTLSAVARR